MGVPNECIGNKRETQKYMHHSKDTYRYVYYTAARISFRGDVSASPIKETSERGCAPLFFHGNATFYGAFSYSVEQTLSL